MKLKSRDLFFIGIVIFVVGGLWWLSTKNRAKAMPADPPHLAAKSREECLKCHLPEKLAELELQHKHPGKWRDERVNCLLCHPAPSGSTAQGFDRARTQMAAQAAWARRYWQQVR